MAVLDDLEILQRAKELEEQHVDDEYPWNGFTCGEIGVSPNTLRRLLYSQLLIESYSSRNYTRYKLAPEGSSTGVPVQEGPLVIPDDMFDIIVGCQQVKSIITRILKAPRPVHILLVGPPATAKTLFLSEVCRLGRSRYALGGTTSRAGIVDYILGSEPRYLIIDEIDKMDIRDHSALLSVMETGIVTRMKRGLQETMELTCWVFAGANDISRIPKELLSRFLTMHVPIYSEQEFQEIVRSVLTRRENVDPEIADYIAHKIVPYSNDVRDAVRVGRLANSVQEVDEVLRTVWR